MEETFARLEQTKIFIKFNIRQVFYRIRVYPDSEELTSFRTRYNNYKYKILLFRLINSSSTYQRYINDILFNYLDDFYLIYFDDILIYSHDVLDHESYIKKIFQRLREAGL
jgi:hypothetical protein